MKKNVCVGQTFWYDDGRGTPQWCRIEYILRRGNGDIDSYAVSFPAEGEDHDYCGIHSPDILKFLYDSPDDAKQNNTSEIV